MDDNFLMDVEELDRLSPDEIEGFLKSIGIDLEEEEHGKSIPEVEE